VAAADPAPPRRVLRISPRSAAIGVGVLVLAIVAERVFVAAHRPLSWFLAAVVVAVLIDPIVNVLDRRLPRLASVIVALLVLALVTWGVIFFAFSDLSQGVHRLGDAAKDAAVELEHRDDSVGDAARDVAATRRVNEFVDALNKRVTGGNEVLASTAGTAPTYFLGGILILFLMSYGPSLARSALDQLPDDRQRATVSDIVVHALQRSRRAVLLTVAEGIVIGVVVRIVAGLLGLPAPAMLGLAAGVMALLPHVGLVLGTLPLVLLILALRSDAEAVAAVTTILACQLTDSYWIRRQISLRSVHVGLLVPWTVALVGYSVYGVGGVVFGVAIAVFGLAALDELAARTRAPDEPLLPGEPTPAQLASMPEGDFGGDGGLAPGAEAPAAVPT
jgi:predicted PurR-regulated permease PerM